MVLLVSALSNYINLYVVIVIHKFYLCGYLKIVKYYWSEVNHRVNYPVLIRWTKISGDFSFHRYCVSWFSLHVGIKYFMGGWNSHYIPGEHFIFI